MQNLAVSTTESSANGSNSAVAGIHLFVPPDFWYEGQPPASFIRRVSGAIMEVVENELLLALSQHGQPPVDQGEVASG